MSDVREARMAVQAWAAIEYAHGLDDGGHPEARRLRLVAADVLALLGELHAERAARHHHQASAERALALLADRAGQAAAEAARS